jgi:hypothetical protein
MSEPDSVSVREIRLRFQRLLLKRSLALTELAIAAERTLWSIRAFAAAFAERVDREVAEHPDLAEVNVALDGWYST